jgi:hypothetical protein
VGQHSELHSETILERINTVGHHSETVSERDYQWDST